MTLEELFRYIYYFFIFFIFIFIVFLKACEVKVIVYVSVLKGVSHSVLPPKQCKYFTISLQLWATTHCIIVTAVVKCVCF